MAAGRFDDSLRFVLKWEGEEFTNDPDDRGGATKWGVIQSRYDQYRRSIGKPLQSVAKITMPEVDDIYLLYYWNAVNGDTLPATVDTVVFDAAVNNGPARGAKWLQRVLGVKDDGVIGPATIAAANAYVAKHGAKQLAQGICDRREQFYEDIAHGNQRKWLKGWMNRLDDLRGLFGLVDGDGKGR